MKIYPDPELPDIKVEWYDADCQPGSGDVVVALDGIDDPSEHAEISAPCTDLKIEFPDVARERYRITGTLLDTAGTPLGGEGQVADLRNGIGARVSLYFGNIRVAFGFESGVTCESLDAMFAGARFTLGGQSFIGQSDCSSGAVFTRLQDGMFTVGVYAFDEDFRVVASSETIEVEVAPDRLTNVGPLTLVPCGASCPSP